MINLLPLEEKQKLLEKKKRKITIILGIIILLSLAYLSLFLLAIKFYILSETDYQRSILSSSKSKNQNPDFASLNTIIKKYNGILGQLDSFYKKEIYFSQALKDISGIPSSAGLYLTNFSLNRDEAGNVKAIVAGVSDTRDNLLAFKKNIEEDKNIKNPSFSPESWINPKNVNFYLTLEISVSKNETNQ